MRGVFDSVPNTLLSNVGVPGATSQHVLDHQVSLALENNVIPVFATNLGQILQALCSCLPDTAIFVSNLYTVDLPGVPQVDAVVSAFNNVVEQVVTTVSWGGCDVALVDIHSAFADRTGLLLIERNQSNLLEVHPTNAGYRVMAQAFIDAIEAQ